MGFNCSASPYFTALFAVIGGALIAASFVAWRNPQGQLAQRNVALQADAISRRFRLNGPVKMPLVGSVFILVGIFLTWQLLTNCGNDHTNLVKDIVGLFVPAPPILIVYGLTTVLLIVAYAILPVGIALRIVVNTLRFAWFSAGAVAAWIHVGRLADQWFSLCVLIVVLLLPTGALRSKLESRRLQKSI